MAKGKKFDYRVVQDGSLWATEIVRRITSKKTTVSKRQGEFTTEAEAQAWGEQELKSFLLNLKKRNKRRDEARQEQGD